MILFWRPRLKAHLNGRCGLSANRYAVNMGRDAFTGSLLTTFALLTLATTSHVVHAQDQSLTIYVEPETGRTYFDGTGAMFIVDFYSDAGAIRRDALPRDLGIVTGFDASGDVIPFSVSPTQGSLRFSEVLGSPGTGVTAIGTSGTAYDFSMLGPVDIGLFYDPNAFDGTIEQAELEADLVRPGSSVTYPGAAFNAVGTEPGNGFVIVDPIVIVGIPPFVPEPGAASLLLITSSCLLRRRS